MKKIFFAILVGLFCTQSYAQFIANAVRLTQRNAANTTFISADMVPPASSANGIWFYDGSTGVPSYLTIGSGLSVSSGALTASGAAQVNSDWSASSGVAQILNKPTTLSGYGITDAYPLTGNPSSFLTGITSGQVTTALGFTPYNATNPSNYITASSSATLTNKGGNISQWTNDSSYITQSGARSAISLTTTGSGAATYNSTTGVLNVPTPSATSRVKTSVTKALNTCFQVSATRDARVTYNADISSSSNLTGGQKGTLYLETFTDSSCTTGTEEIMHNTSGNTMTVGVSVGNTVSQTLNVNGTIMAGLWAKLRTNNDTGTPTFTAQKGQEIQE